MTSGNRKALRRVVTALALACSSAALVVLHSSSRAVVSPLGRLVHSAPRSYRLVEARIAGGFSWAPIADGLKTNRSADEEADLMLFAGRILAESRRTRSLEVLHASAAAKLLIGDADEAMRRLEEIVRRAPYDGQAWNDLAAARYTAAVDRGEPYQLAAALAAVDEALRLRPTDPRPRFNRALILEQMGVSGPAMSAWQDVLAVETDPQWAAEARRHVLALRSALPRPFRREFQSVLARATAGERAPLERLVRQRTQEARTTAESILLAEWADAAASGSTSSAYVLDRARLVGAFLADVNGDRFLQDVIRVIDAAQTDERRRPLIKAHRLYRDGRLHYRDHREGSAEELRRAGAAFDEAGSPMAEAAHYYAANATFDQGRTEDARVMLERLLDRVDEQRHPSLVGGVEMELGRYYAFRGIWSVSLRYLARAARRFHDLGEWTNAAFAELCIAEIHDRIGQFGEGWRRRVSSLQVLSRFAPDDRLVTALIGGAHVEIMKSDPDSALSLLNLAIKEAERIGHSVMLAEATLRRARVLASVDDLEESRRTLIVARRAAARIEDVASRARIEADVATVEGQVLRRTDPCAAVSVLTEPIRFYETHSLEMLLPVPYLERARARLACGDAGLALADLEKGLANVERQRAEVAADVRVTVFDTIPELIAETVSLLLAEGRNEDAYAVVERARSRTLVEALGMSGATNAVKSAEVIACLPERAAVVEYALLPRGLAVFSLTRNGLAVTRIPIEPQRLRDLVNAFVSATADRQPLGVVQDAAGELYDLLIDPVANRIAGSHKLFVVPDRFLNLVPFPALFHRTSRRYLIEEREVVISPSGAFLCEQAETAANGAALILSDPQHGSDVARLPAAHREATAIARLYERSVVLVGNDATIDRFRQEAPAAGLIHYSGHAESDDAGGFLPLAASGGDEGKCDATEISRLPLHRTRLVVLAGCATLIGSPRRVEGMPSLSRSFLAAGVPSVVGMLWDVNDAAMSSVLLPFHRAIVGGASPAAALRDAQLGLISSTDARLHHPATWGAAELLGVD